MLLQLFECCSSLANLSEDSEAIIKLDWGTPLSSSHLLLGVSEANTLASMNQTSFSSDGLLLCKLLPIQITTYSSSFQI